MKETKDDNPEEVNYVLPQGSPTSPIITNMICDRLDHFLSGLAKRFGLKYSRYADDITFSSMHYVYQPKGKFLTELKRIIEEQGFKINNDKTRLQKKGSRQEVTGVIVSDKLNVSKKYVRDIRNILYIWDRYGFQSAYAKFFPKYKAEKGHVKKGNPDLVNVLDGKLMYLKMVKGEDDCVYSRLHSKFIQLTEEIDNPEKTNIYGIQYIETTPVKEFEHKNKTEIIVKTSLIQKDNEDGSKYEMEHIYACFIVNGATQNVYVHQFLEKYELEDKNILSISYCRDASNKPFWLLHKSNKTFVKPEGVDIDELNNELDSLLNTKDG